ncbi:P-loop NTPase fold protein [Asticcacaulis sp. AC466]|uniref:P-loop NTPase fold protein n=1 Tax=Asticcacaulis sp. AC466 TaxID=1282362 RepID=UPI00138AFC58|nr:P-loop NTPase fold protein [Asticcacaulis sp. AC466]
MSSTNSPNAHIFEYLDYYCDSDNKTDYAVLLTGPWGAGKTYLIKEYRERLKASLKTETLFVSLYGMSSTDQIDFEFFRQLHPVLASDGMKLAAKFGKAFLKGALKIDIDADGKDDGTLSLALPDLDSAAKGAKRPKDYILIFDDLERSSLDLAIVLGYINYIVEHQGSKAIILANSAKIRGVGDESESDEKEGGKSSADKAFDAIKEKLIGQTLEIKPDAEATLAPVLESFPKGMARDFLIAHRTDILDLQRETATGNLRTLKHGLKTFERMTRAFESCHWANQKAVMEIFRACFILVAEHKLGKLPRSEMAKLDGVAIRSLMLSDTKKRPDFKTYEYLKTKYPTFPFRNTVPSTKTFATLICDGCLDWEELRAELNDSPHYRSPRAEQPWERLYHYWTMNDADFDADCAAVEAAFQNREYVETGVVFHVFGVRLAFVKVGSISQTADDVVRECKAYIDFLSDNRHLAPDFSADAFLPEMGYGGRAYTHGETPEFAEIVRHYQVVLAKISEERLTEVANGLMALIDSNLSQFTRQLVFNNFQHALYYDRPVLARIAPIDFVEKILSVGGEAQVDIFNTLKLRYENDVIRHALAPERAWLKAVSDELTRRLPFTGKLSKYRLQTRLQHVIKPILDAADKQDAEEKASRATAKGAFADGAPPAKPAKKSTTNSSEKGLRSKVRNPNGKKNKAPHGGATERGSG